MTDVPVRLRLEGKRARFSPSPDLLVGRRIARRHTGERRIGNAQLLVREFLLDVVQPLVVILDLGACRLELGEQIGRIVAGLLALGDFERRFVATGFERLDFFQHGSTLAVQFEDGVES